MNKVRQKILVVNKKRNSLSSSLFCFFVMKQSERQANR
jgi:hypothetical protein